VVGDLDNPPQLCRKCHAELNASSETEEHVKAGLCNACLTAERNRQRARIGHEQGKFRVTTYKQQTLF